MDCEGFTTHQPLLAFPKSTWQYCTMQYQHPFPIVAASCMCGLRWCWRQPLFWQPLLLCLPARPPYYTILTVCQILNCTCWGNCCILQVLSTNEICAPVTTRDSQHHFVSAVMSSLYVWVYRCSFVMHGCKNWITGAHA